MLIKSRVTSQSHEFNYAEPLKVESCTQSICDLALRFGEGAEGEVGGEILCGYIVLTAGRKASCHDLSV